MSTVQENRAVWSVRENVDPKYEKYLNITEEIYKRIDITFQIKKLESTRSDISDQSDQFDSNDLSNETDLFACDKSSLSSSTDAEKPPLTKYININNNNEEKPKVAVVYKRPRKRFRKRVKKRQSKQHNDSDGSSDEGLPLSRIVDIDIDKCASEGQESADNVMGVPNILILAKDSKPKKSIKKDSIKLQLQSEVIPCDATESVEHIGQVQEKTIDKETGEKSLHTSNKEKAMAMKNCKFCSLSFRGDRGLRRHMAMSHITET